MREKRRWRASSSAFGRTTAAIVRLGGAELHQYPEEQLGRSIGYLPQDVKLYDGTIGDNICRFRENVQPDEVIDAAKRADVHSLILSFTDGYETRIGEGGASLSAGQRQRIGLARALFGGPTLIVLDEPNANLDAAGEKAVINAIPQRPRSRQHRDRGGRTVRAPLLHWTY